MVRSSRFVAAFAAATLALATAGAAGATAPPTSDPVQEAAFEYAQCLRDNGIEEYPDPQVREDGGVLILSPLDVADASNEEVAAAQAACLHILEEAGPPSTDPDGSAPDGASSGSSSAGESEWDKIVLGGDCVCADGSEFAFWERKADPTKVVFYLDGGGVCTDATTCAFTGMNGENDFYNWSVVGEDPAFPGGGILDFDRADNPFADYSFIYVGSCTGDADLGDVTREYSPELTVEHNGFVNGTAALSYLVEQYRDATQVVVVGNTSPAAPVYGGLVADLLPDAQVTVFGAGWGAYPDNPDFNAEILGELWAPTTTCPTGKSTKGSPPATGASPGSGSRPACMTPTSSWPASTTPSTPTRRGRWNGWAGTRRTTSP